MNRDQLAAALAEFGGRPSVIIFEDDPLEVVAARCAARLAERADAHAAAGRVVCGCGACRVVRHGREHGEEWAAAKPAAGGKS